MTKAALIMMTQSYALELGPKGVRVNAIAPGLMQTVLSEYYWKDEDRFAEDALTRAAHSNTWASRHEIAEVALILAGEQRLIYLTGQTIVMDGGTYLVVDVMRCSAVFHLGCFFCSDGHRLRCPLRPR